MATTIQPSYLLLFFISIEYTIEYITYDQELQCSHSFAFSLYGISTYTLDLFVCMCWIICSLEKQKNRTLNTLGNLTFSGTLNGQLLDASRISGTTEDLFTSKLKAELDRSINKHLEAAPHDNSKPVIRLHSDSMNSSYAKSNADYLEVLQRKYHV